MPSAAALSANANPAATAQPLRPIPAAPGDQGRTLNQQAAVGDAWKEGQPAHHSQKQPLVKTTAPQARLAASDAAIASQILPPAAGDALNSEGETGAEVRLRGLGVPRHGE